jgi:hypothetical protein
VQDGAATRDELARLAARVAPRVPLRERRLRLDGPAARLAPGGLPRSGVVQVLGPPGSGVTSLGVQLAAAASRAGEWVAALDDGTLGGLALLEAGVAAERFAVVRAPRAGADWARVAAMLVDGFGLVLADPPRTLGARDARRLQARLRERDALLVVLGPWPFPGVRRTLEPAGAPDPAGARRSEGGPMVAGASPVRLGRRAG